MPLAVAGVLDVSSARGEIACTGSVK